MSGPFLCQEGVSLTLLVGMQQGDEKTTKCHLHKTDDLGETVFGRCGRITAARSVLFVRPCCSHASVTQRLSVWLLRLDVASSSIGIGRDFPLD